MKKEKFVHEKPIDFGPLTEDELILRIVRNLEADLAAMTKERDGLEAEMGMLKMKFVPQGHVDITKLKRKISDLEQALKGQVKDERDNTRLSHV